MKIVEYKVGNAKAVLRGFIHHNLSDICPSYDKRPAIVICPGGGYSHLSPRESEPVAFEFFAKGYQPFILYYSIKEDVRKSTPEEELAASLRLIRENSRELDVDEDKIGVIGFSAGGHLAASLCCHWSKYGEESKPNLGVLCYPVITTGKYSHGPSVDLITNGRDKELMNYYSLENQVTKNTPPIFIWHTTKDGTVPVYNTLAFVSALLENDVPFECHLYERGDHALVLANKEVGRDEEEVRSWLPLLLKWLNIHWEF